MLHRLAAEHPADYFVAMRIEATAVTEHDAFRLP
jgi:hypothetical protein